VVVLHGKEKISSDAPISKRLDKSEIMNYNSINDEDMMFNDEDGTYGRSRTNHEGSESDGDNDDGKPDSNNNSRLPALHSLDGVWYLRVPRNISAMKLITHVANVLTTQQEENIIVEDVDV
jgi:hypothetical protein